MNDTTGCLSTDKSIRGSIGIVMPGIFPFLTRAAVCLCLLSGISFAHAEILNEGDRVMVEVGPYVYHRLDNDGHNQWPHVIGVEYETASQWVVGASTFENSYYQDAAMLYGGKRWFIPRVSENLYVKVLGALVYGYKKPHDHALPINHNGYGLAIAPVVGYQFGRANVQLVLLGTAAGVVTVGYDIWK